MKNLLIALTLLLSTPSFASFGFDCSTADQKISMYIIDYASMLNIQSINIDGKTIKSDKLASNFYMGSILAIRIMDDQLNKQLLVAELKPKLNPEMSIFEGPAVYLNSKGESVNTILTCGSEN